MKIKIIETLSKNTTKKKAFVALIVSPLMFISIMSTTVMFIPILYQMYIDGVIPSLLYSSLAFTTPIIMFGAVMFWAWHYMVGTHKCPKCSTQF